MSNINFAYIHIQGRLTSDPELVTLDGGRSLCKFRVAVNKRFGKKEKTSFIPVSVFGPDADNCGKYLSKGREVSVSGDFETDEWVDKEGNRQRGFSVIAHDRGVIFGSGGQLHDEEYQKPTVDSGSRVKNYMRDRRGSKW